jgi:hypothetical protein
LKVSESTSGKLKVDESSSEEKPAAARRRTYIAAGPGWVHTDMGGQGATLSIEERIPRLADMLEQRQSSGGIAFVNFANQDLPW